MAGIQKIKKAFALAAISLVCSCSAQFRFNRLISKNPELISTKFAIDSTEKIIPEKMANFPFPLRDTTVSGIKTSLHKTQNNLPFMQITCPKDTVICEDKIIQYEIKDPDFFDYSRQYLGWAIATLFFALLVIRK